MLIIFGAGFIAYAIGSLIRFTVEGELRSILGRKKLEKQINKLSDHYIICGYGRIGSRPQIPVVVVEEDLEICEKLSDEGKLFVHGDATDDDTLIAAGIKRAKGLITVVTLDTGHNLELQLEEIVVCSDSRLVGTTVDKADIRGDLCRV